MLRTCLPIIRYATITLVLVFVYLFLHVNDLGPPHWIELRQQRQQFAERLKNAGGWDAIRNDCVKLAEQNPDGFFSWFPGTNLPPALAALKSEYVHYHGEGVIEVKVFGGHATGGHSTPYYGLEVLVTNLPDHVPAPSHTASGNAHTKYRKVAPGIFEVY